MSQSTVSTRCQERKVVAGSLEGAEQCRLGSSHRCECLFMGDPLSLLQGLAWNEEMLAVATQAHNEAIEQAARMVHRGTDDDALIERVRLLKRDP